MAGLRAVEGPRGRSGGGWPAAGPCWGSAWACRCCSSAGSSTGWRPRAATSGRAGRAAAGAVVPTWGGTPSTCPPASRLFAGVEGERFYFVHSYGVRDWELDTHGRTPPPLVTWAEHGGDRFVAAVENGPLRHPVPPREVRRRRRRAAAQLGGDPVSGRREQGAGERRGRARAEAAGSRPLRAPRPRKRGRRDARKERLTGWVPRGRPAHRPAGRERRRQAAGRRSPCWSPQPARLRVHPRLASRGFDAGRQPAGRPDRAHDAFEGREAQSNERLPRAAAGRRHRRRPGRPARPGRGRLGEAVRRPGRGRAALAGGRRRVDPPRRPRRGVRPRPQPRAAGRDRRHPRRPGRAERRHPRRRVARGRDGHRLPPGQHRHRRPRAAGVVRPAIADVGRPGGGRARRPRPDPRRARLDPRGRRPLRGAGPARRRGLRPLRRHRRQQGRHAPGPEPPAPPRRLRRHRPAGRGQRRDHRAGRHRGAHRPGAGRASRARSSGPRSTRAGSPSRTRSP